MLISSQRRHLFQYNIQSEETGRWQVFWLLSAVHLHSGFQYHCGKRKLQPGLEQSHRDQPHLEVALSWLCSFCWQGQLQSSCPNVTISGSSTIPDAGFLKTSRMVADRETSTTLVQEQSFQYLNSDAFFHVCPGLACSL